MYSYLVIGVYISNHRIQRLIKNKNIVKNENSKEKIVDGHIKKKKYC
jgi:hypothetical protein